jgi:iron(III) transport system substrate-binding protein
MKPWLKKFTAAALFAAVSAPAMAAEVNLYTSRKEQLIAPLLEQFTAKTGIDVNLLTGDASALIKRLQSEGGNTPADVLLTTDAGNLHTAKAAGLFQPVESAALAAAIPANLRDADNQWFGLSARSRVIVYSKDRVKDGEIASYEDLADPKWQGRVCIRSSSNVYNQSLLASMIANKGSAEAERWAKGVVANFARKPQGNDRGQVQAVAAGECDIAVVNTYYLGVMATSDDDAQKTAAASVSVLFPNQADRGAHVNVSGAGVTAAAKHRDEAIKLIEFLASPAAQAWYAETNHEYPVVDGVEPSALVKSWGYPFKSDSLNITKLGENNAEAVKVFDRAGWQ